MTTDNGNVDCRPRDPIGPGTPAWEAGDDAREALIHCFRQVAPHVGDRSLSLELEHWAESIKTDALESFKLRQDKILEPY